MRPLRSPAPRRLAVAVPLATCLVALATVTPARANPIAATSEGTHTGCFGPNNEYCFTMTGGVQLTANHVGEFHCTVIAPAALWTYLLCETPGVRSEVMGDRFFQVTGGVDADTPTAENATLCITVQGHWILPTDPYPWPGYKKCFPGTEVGL